MKVIFFDVDGVLNSMECKGRFNNNNVKMLAEIQKRSNGVLVICSTWKTLPESHEMYISLLDKLKEFNLSIYDKTANINKGRPYEIKEWIDRHAEVEEYVLLDDDYPAREYAKFGLDEHLVHTVYFCNNTSEGGLQKEHVEKALKILKNIEE